MKGFTVVVVTLALTAWAASAQGIEPGCREIRASLIGGVASPSGDAAELMKSGPVAGGEIGIAFTPRVVAGFRFEGGSLTSKVAVAGSGDALRAVGDNPWTHYAGTVFCEYLLGDSRLAPVIGADAGVHGLHISFAGPITGASGVGNYGVGYGIFGGLRYRANQRFGGIMDVEAQNSPAVGGGWYYRVRAGLAIFL